MTGLQATVPSSGSPSGRLPLLRDVRTPPQPAEISLSFRVLNVGFFSGCGRTTLYCPAAFPSTGRGRGQSWDTEFPSEGRLEPSVCGSQIPVACGSAGWGLLGLLTP